MFAHSLSPLENPQSIRSLRRDIARLKTQLRKIQIGKPKGPRISDETRRLMDERDAAKRLIQKVTPKYSWTAEIKSVPDFKCISPKQINILLSSKQNGNTTKPSGESKYITNDHALRVQLPKIKIPIPLFIVFRALGVISDGDII